MGEEFFKSSSRSERWRIGISCLPLCPSAYPRMMMLGRGFVSISSRSIVALRDLLRDDFPAFLAFGLVFRVPGGFLLALARILGAPSLRAWLVFAMALSLSTSTQTPLIPAIPDFGTSRCKKSPPASLIESRMACAVSTFFLLFANE